MLSLLARTRPKKTTLIFPDDQNLWKFFALTELSVFRIESSNHTIAGKFDAGNIDLAKERFGASELPSEDGNSSETNHIFRHVNCLVRAACALF